MRKSFCEVGIAWEGLYFALRVSNNRFGVLYMYIVIFLVVFYLLNNVFVKLA